jgi:hypothetical protein
MQDRKMRIGFDGRLSPSRTLASTSTRQITTALAALLNRINPLGNKTGCHGGEPVGFPDTNLRIAAQSPFRDGYCGTCRSC